MEIKKYINEVWRPVRGYEGLYEVSNFGRVRSLDRFDRHGRFWKGMIRKPIRDPLGYLDISLSKHAKMSTHQVHRLVMEAFVPNPNNLPCVNHKDRNTSNNYVHLNEDGSVDLEKSNLEWCSYSYNNQYSHNILGKERKSGPDLKPVLQYSTDGTFIKRYGSAKIAAEELNKPTKDNIKGCCLLKQKTAYGFVWRYEQE